MGLFGKNITITKNDIQKTLFTFALFYFQFLTAQSVDNMAIAEYNLGVDYGARNDYTLAIEKFSNAIKIDPNYTQAYYNRGAAKAGLYDHYGAIGDLKMALEIGVCCDGFDELEYEIYFKLAISKKILGDNKGSLADVNKAIELKPTKTNDDRYFPFYLRASCKVQLDDYYGAIYDFTKAIEMQSLTPESYGGRGLAKNLLGDLDGACKDYEKASNLGNESAQEDLNEYCR